MLRSHLTTTLRRLRRDAGYATINLAGLAVGLAACLLIGLYVRHELSFDTQHPHHERTYRVVQYETGFDGEANWRASTSGLLAPRLREDGPGVEAATRLWTRAPEIVQHGGRATTGLTSFAAEPSFFDLFGFDLVRGAAEGLARPHTAVLTRALAERLFADGAEAAVGETLQTDLLGKTTMLEVVGVMADPPPNTHLGGFDLLLSFASLEARSGRISIDNAQFTTYARLRPEAAPEDVAEAIAAQIGDVHVGGQRVEDVRMQPLADIYFGDLWAPRTGDRRYVAVFGAIAGVILLIACVNYMNLATARTTRRGRETGVRKTLGASRALVAVQFVSEAVLLSLMAVPVALALVALAVPSFNALTGAEVVLEAGAAPLVGVVVGAALVVGLVAGSYPAVALSRYRPLQMIRGQLDTGAQGRRVRQGLVVVQFALTAALLFATGMVLRQLDYLQARDLGFEEEQVVGLELADETVRERAAAVRDAFAAVPGVEHVTLAAGLPGSDVGYFGRIASSIERDGEHISLHHGYVDAAYAEALGLRLVAGRLLRPGDAASERVEGKTNEPILLNETAARAFGWDPPAEAVGQTLSYFRGDKPVVGVVEDFHYASLHHAIEPLALHVTPQFADRVVAVRLRAGGTGAGGEDGGGDVRATLARLEAAWDDVAPHLPFEPRFLDATVDAQYRAEERAARLVTAFAAVAVVLACLGLFGLATYAAARRTKEISIRKVLGATTRQVVTLLSKEFAALVALALLLGAPLAFYGVTQWLDGFAYRAPLSPASFLLAGALAMAVALASVGVQTVRAARLDPARALRSE